MFTQIYGHVDTFLSAILALSVEALSREVRQTTRNDSILKYYHLNCQAWLTNIYNGCAIDTVSQHRGMQNCVGQPFLYMTDRNVLHI